MVFCRQMGMVDGRVQMSGCKKSNRRPGCFLPFLSCMKKHLRKILFSVLGFGADCCFTLNNYHAKKRYKLGKAKSAYLCCSDTSYDTFCVH